MKTKDNTGLAPSNLHQDRELFYRISEGENAALEILFDKYYQPLCHFGRSYEQNIAVVEEKISDVFILLWKNRKGLTQINKPKSYIYVIAKNSLKNKNNQLHQPLEDWHNQFIPFSPSTEENLIDQEEKILTTYLIQSVLERIPQKSKKIFELSRIDGLKYKEISIMENISPRTVENHIALAMKYISKGLKEFHTKTKK